MLTAQHQMGGGGFFVFFSCQIWYAHTKVIHDGDFTLHQKERVGSSYSDMIYNA